MPEEQAALQTQRMNLEPVTEDHTQELWDLFKDPELHPFVPFEPISIEMQRERCERWSKRRSPDGKEIWLNWAGRDQASGQIMSRFQIGVKEGVATIGYLVARAFQGKGYATEGLETVFDHLKTEYAVKEVKAWTDTRNVASHRLAKKLGMIQVKLIKGADFFKGAQSDEFIFSKVL